MLRRDNFKSKIRLLRELCLVNAREKMFVFLKGREEEEFINSFTSNPCVREEMDELAKQLELNITFKDEEIPVTFKKNCLLKLMQKFFVAKFTNNSDTPGLFFDNEL